VGAACIPQGVAHAQELEPRFLTNVPVHTNFVIGGYAFATGNILLDPSIPVEDLNANLHTFLGAYVRAIDFFGLSGKVDAVVPFASGDWTGRLAGQDAARSVTGFGDPRVRLSVGLVGSPALRKAEFVGWRQKTILGASLQVIMPLGQYDSSELINLGSNRWTFRPEIGLSHAVSRKWTLEASVSAWLFTDNTDFLEGMTLSQDVLYVAEFHAIRALRPGFWWALGAGWGDGGRTSVDGVPRQTIQKNWRFGATIAYPVTPREGVILALNSGHTRKAGNDFDSVALSYQFAWGDI